MRYRILLALLLALASAPVHAAETFIELMPGRSIVDIRAYGMGLLPLDGAFTHFDGALRYDPSDRQHCSVSLHVDVASLTMPDNDVRADILGPDFLDVAQFPALSYQGTCAAAGLEGQLTMHGVTRPFALVLDWSGSTVTAVGRLVRADWDMAARPVVGGKTVRITVSVELPSSQHAGP